MAEVEMTYSAETIAEMLAEVERQDRYYLTRPNGELERQWATVTRQLLAERDTARTELAAARQRILELETEIDTSRGYL